MNCLSKNMGIQLLHIEVLDLSLNISQGMNLGKEIRHYKSILP